METNTPRSAEDTATVFEPGYEYLMRPEWPTEEPAPAQAGAYESLWEDGPAA